MIAITIISSMRVKPFWIASYEQVHVRWMCADLRGRQTIQWAKKEAPQLRGFYIYVAKMALGYG
jgi:hypothetical protein